MKIFKTVTNYLLLTSLCLPHIGLAQSTTDAQDSSVQQTAPPVNTAPALTQENSRALSVILTYLDDFSYSYKIDYPWVEKDAKTSEFEVLKSIETHLKQRFSDESNSVIHPGWINSQSILFERREVCVDYGEITTKDNKQKYKTSSSSAQGNTNGVSDTRSQTVASGVSLEKRNLLSSERVALATAVNETTNNSKVTGTTYESSGYTIIETTEKEKMTFCKRSRIDFRGTLQSEKILHADTTAPHVKFYLVNRALKALLGEFRKSLNLYTINLNYVLTTQGMTDSTIESMKLQNADQIQNSGVSGLVEYFSARLISLITVYKRLGDIIELSSGSTNEYFRAMTKNTERAKEQVFLGLMKVYLTLEPYGRIDRTVQETSWGKTTSTVKSEKSNELTIGISQGQGIKTVTLFRESELKLLFKGLGDFSFKAEKPNPGTLAEKYASEQKQLSEANLAEQRKQEESSRKYINVGDRVIDKRSGAAGTVREAFSDGTLKILFDSDSYRFYVRNVSEVSPAIKR